MVDVLADLAGQVEDMVIPVSWVKRFVWGRVHVVRYGTWRDSTGLAVDPAACAQESSVDAYIVLVTRSAPMRFLGDGRGEIAVLADGICKDEVSDLAWESVKQHRLFLGVRIHGRDVCEFSSPGSPGL